ncbi:SOS response-associated peptidase family protein [Sphingomonas echinoides]|uniref:SOS response-associated peptidase family protein n=1 Tax=Sphingomonas echinoides TaxID=59803 RepID=UPI0024136D0B|nr:SOS response-associated peptidase family protein [Sphingomonas echinoides]
MGDASVNCDIGRSPVQAHVGTKIKLQIAVWLPGNRDTAYRRRTTDVWIWIIVARHLRTKSRLDNLTQRILDLNRAAVEGVAASTVVVQCLIPLSEFCEWTLEAHDLGDGKKPLKGEMWFQVTDQALFAVAGFWQPTARGNGFTMVTCNPNELVAPIHQKAMITVLEEADHDRWLRGSYDDVVALQRPYAAERMTVRGPVFPTRRA